jgi:hypothetical protein
MMSMVQLQALECMAAPTFLIMPGDLFERDKAEAHDLVKAGYAIVVEGQPHKDEDHSDKPTRKVRGHK